MSGFGHESDRQGVLADSEAKPAFYEIAVIGDPVPWGVAKVGRYGNRFVPAKPSMQADRFRMEWQRQGIEPAPKGVGFELAAEFVVRRPKYHFGTGRNSGRLKPQYIRARPTGRPDLSNLLKLVEDALTTLAWVDDDQVVGYRTVSKRFADPGEQPRSTVRLFPQLAA